jgi:hypothetical protein
MILALTDHLTMFQWEIMFAKLVTLLVKPVLEMQRTNVFLVHQPNISTPILVMILVLMDHQTTLILIRFVKLVTPLAKPVLEMQRINVFLVPLTNIFSQILVMILALTDHLTMFQWEIIFAKLVTPLAKPVLEMQPT